MAVVTATWNVPDPACLVTPVGSEPVTRVALRPSTLRYSSSAWGGAPVAGGRPPETGVEVVVSPAHCAVGGDSGRPSRCSPAATLRWMTASCVAVR